MKSLFITFSALCLVSCVMVHRYPEEWAGLKGTEGNRCPDIAGTFSDVGFSTFSPASCKDSSPCRLSAHLFGSRAGGGSHVKISQPTYGLLQIELLRGGKVVEERSLAADKNEFVCTADGLKISRFEHAYMMAGTTSTFFQRAEDGALIARLVESGAGGVVAFPLPAPLPFAFHAGSWIRWMPASE